MSVVGAVPIAKIINENERSSCATKSNGIDGAVRTNSDDDNIIARVDVPREKARGTRKMSNDTIKKKRIKKMIKTKKKKPVEHVLRGGVSAAIASRSVRVRPPVSRLRNTRTCVTRYVYRGYRRANYYR